MKKFTTLLSLILLIAGCGKEYSYVKEDFTVIIG